MAWLNKKTGSEAAESANDPESAPVAANDVGDPSSGTMATVQIDSGLYEVTELGVKAFKAVNYEGSLISHQRFDFLLIFKVDGDEIILPAQGFVVSIDESGDLLARIARPQPFYLNLLTKFLINWHRAKLAQESHDEAS